MASRILGFIIFFAVFILGYFAMNWYVFTRLGGLLEIERTFWFYFVMVAMALSFPMLSILERFVDGQFIRVFYIGSAVWLGALFLFLCSLGVYEVVRLFAKIDTKTTGIVILAVVSLLSVFSIINAFFINVKTVDVQIPNLKEDVKIVQLSDIHIGTIHNSEYLSKIVEKTNALRPDIVMITGDLADGSGILTQKGIAPLNKLRAKTFFTLGNHEIYEGIDNVTKLLSRTNMTILRNELVNYNGIQIIGIDNPNQMTGERFNISSIKINKTKPSVLMYHPPSELKEASKAGINLQLSGHTHDGQIWPFNYVVQIFFPRVNGLYNYNGMYLYVSPGTGTWGPPFRLGSRSEITVIKLVRK
jgi:hypothetical protein